MEQHITDNIGRRRARENSVSNLVPIEAAYFYEGMYLNFSVYVKSGKSFSLLCSNVTLTESLLEKIDVAEDSGNLICVDKKSYREILLNAAQNAENEGITIDWDSVYELANNPPNVEEFTEDISDSEVIDPNEPKPEIIALNNIAILAAKAISQKEKESEEDILNSASVKLVNPQDVVNVVIESVSKEDEDKEAAESEKNKEKEKDSKLLGFSEGPKPRISESISPDDIVKALIGFSDKKEDKEDIVIAPEKIEKIEIYKDISINVRKIFEESAEGFKFDAALVNSISERLSHLVRTSGENIIIQCMRYLRENEGYLISHTVNAACINALMGKWLGFSRDESIEIVKVGILHDIGEQLIPEDILFKPSRLTDEEYELIKKHSIYSYRICMASGITNTAILRAVRNHHERINGSGYPDGLKANDIPLYARIMAVSDTFNAMVTKKPYRKNYTALDVIQKFSTIRDTELDSKLVNILIDNITKLFIGKKVQLTDGSFGSIISVNSSGYDCPMVLVNGKYIKTNKYNKVVYMDLYTDN
ncbi:MAG: HD-GYP domain-containing protein [Anaerovoracaceae bacterium]